MSARLAGMLAGAAAWELLSKTGDGGGLLEGLLVPKYCDNFSRGIFILWAGYDVSSNLVAVMLVQPY